MPGASFASMTNPRLSRPASFCCSPPIGYVVFYPQFLGAEALDFLSNGSIVDLVLLDFSMGAMNGDELAIKLRRKLYPELRLIAVSAVEDLPPALLQVADGQVREGTEPRDSPG